MYYSKIKHYDPANGPGIRMSLFVSGCLFHCKECFNEETWDFNYGKEFTQEVYNQILKDINKDYYSGFSLLGGDPLWQSEEDLQILIDLVKEVSSFNKNIWIWSGFIFENIFKDHSKDEDFKLWEKRKELISLCDVWVDGQFQIENKDLRLKYCGSTNQRVIDVKASLKSGEVVLYESKH